MSEVGILAKRVWGGNDLSRKEPPQPTSSEAQRQVKSIHTLTLLQVQIDCALPVPISDVAVLTGRLLIAISTKVAVPVHTQFCPLQLSWYEDIVCSHASTVHMCCRFQALNVANARALENANIAVIVGTIVLRAVVYSALFWTLPQDKQALLRRQAAKNCAKDVPDLTGEKKGPFHNVMASYKCQGHMSEANIHTRHRIQSSIDRQHCLWLC